MIVRSRLIFSVVPRSGDGAADGAAGDDDAAAALLRYLGRDPHWAPSTISDAAAG